MYSSYYTTQQHVHRSLTTAICVAPLLQHIPFHPKILFPFLPRSFLVAPCRLLLHCWTLYHKLLQADCQKSKPTHGVWACTVGVLLAACSSSSSWSQQRRIGCWEACPFRQTLPHLLHSAPSYKHFIHKEN